MKRPTRSKATRRWDAFDRKLRQTEYQQWEAKLHHEWRDRADRKPAAETRPPHLFKLTSRPTTRP
jgi:hypothetical protein